MPKRTINQQSQILNDIHHFHVNCETRELFLGFDNDDEAMYVSAKMASHVIKNITLLESISKNPILIHISSPGGFVSDAHTIYEVIKNCKSHVTMIGYGEIMSAATTIIQAADTRLLNKTSSFMVHGSNSGFEGGANYLQSSLEEVKRLEKLCYDIYAEKCNQGAFFKERTYTVAKTRAYIIDKVNKKHDWYLTPEEALYYGFIDGIIGSKEYPEIKSYGWTTQNA